jgi:glycine/D-amino acid oxidase-like deaminating enzyme
MSRDTRTLACRAAGPNETGSSVLPLGDRHGTDDELTRRSALELLGAPILAALGVAACEAGGKRYVVDRAGQRGSVRRFVPVEVDRSRLVRSTVGLRPYRNTGFRLEAERLDGKQLIHCYGHGGGGITLSWGTANLAVGLITNHPPPGPVAVLGAGVIGLTTATLLQRRGYDVTIYAATAWPHTTSNASAATFYPSHVIDASRVTPEFTNTLEAALRRSYHAFQRMTGEHYGIRWLDSFFLGDGSTQASPDIETQTQAKVVGDATRLLAKGEHPFAAPVVSQGRDLVIEPMIYLRALLEDVRMAGGSLHIRRFESLRDVALLRETVVINCTGLGSRTLCDDRELRPARGQLCVLPPQPEVDYTLYHGPFYYMVPRQDGIILGGTFELGAESTASDPAQDENIVSAHKAVFDAMR